MNIVPLTPINNLRVCANVPLDSTYTDTITFGSSSSQQSYFAGKTKATDAKGPYAWSNLTPMRLQNKIRLPRVADDFYDCNYICFQNANFGGKWFYCFITAIEYVNPTMTEISFEIDVMQTWMFDYTVKPSYVVREHPNTDNLGEHLLIEPLEVGEYVDESAYRSGHMANYDAVIMYAPNDGPGAGNVGGIFTGLQYEHAPLSGSGGAMLDLLESLVNSNRADSVAATFIMPSDFYTDEGAVVELQLTVPKETSTLGSYTPRNKKLLSYPYNMLSVHNSMGTIHNYRYEYFYNVSSSAIFTMSCPMGVNPEVIIFPRSYNGQAQNFDETLTITGFPQFAYVIDTYRAWFAQNGNAFMLDMLGDTIGLGMAVGAGSAGGTISQGLGLVSNVNSLVMHQQQANSGRGAQGSNAMVALRAKDFYFYQHHVREDYAEILDDYFDMYGYLTNEVKVPNITGRPSWNYVKTDGAKIVGSVPFDDIAIIKANFDKGITFWHGDYVGDYGRGNLPNG